MVKATDGFVRMKFTSIDYIVFIYAVQHIIHKLFTG